MKTKILILTTLFLSVILYLKNKRKNYIFIELSKEDLSIVKQKMITQLENYSRSKSFIRLATVSFDYFVLHPKKFDGSTVVSDLFDVFYKGKKLEVASLIHDFIWVRFFARRKLVLNWWSNWEYFTDLKKHGNPYMYSRYLGLMLISIPLVALNYTIYKLNKMSK